MYLFEYSEHYFNLKCPIFLVLCTYVPQGLLKFESLNWIMFFVKKIKIVFSDGGRKIGRFRSSIYSVLLLLSKGFWRFLSLCF